MGATAVNPKLFWASVFLVHFLTGFYAGMGRGLHQAAQLLMVLVIPIGIVFWLHREMRLRGYKPAFDSGTFLFFGWPVVGPYYAFRLWGWNGFLLILFFIGLMVGGYFAGLMTGGLIPIDRAPPLV